MIASLRYVSENIDMSIFPSRMGPIYQCAKIRVIIWFLDLGSPDEPTLPLPIVPRSLNDEKPVTRLHIFDDLSSPDEF